MGRIRLVRVTFSRCLSKNCCNCINCDTCDIYSPVTRALFPVDDDNVLRFLFEENQRIEPEWYFVKFGLINKLLELLRYCPIIPMVLVNGAEGIGTGWSTKIPNYNPREIVENVRRMINNEPLQPMVSNN